MIQPKIAILVNEGLSEDKAALLNPLLQTLRGAFHLVVLNLPQSKDPQKSSLSPSQLAERLHTEGFTLILAPAPIYLGWKSQVDSLEIQQRFGRIWAGYTLEPFDFRNFEETLRRGDTRVLDFSKMQSRDLLPLFKSLAQPPLRSGLRGLFAQNETEIYCENWQDSMGLGLRVDQILNLPSLTQSAWKKRGHSIRFLILSLWNYFEEKTLQKAYFQITANPELLAIRLTFQSPTQENLFALPPLLSHHRPTPIQGLVHYSHFFRGHLITDNQRNSTRLDYEMTAGLFSSILEGSKEDRNHLIWIDTMHPRWLTEPLNEIPSPNSPWLKVLPPVTLTARGPQRAVSKKSHSRIAPVLEDFQKRYFEAQYEIRQLELKLVDLMKGKGTKEDIKRIKLRIDALAHRETQWIKELSQTLGNHPKSMKRK